MNYYTRNTTFNTVLCHNSPPHNELWLLRILAKWKYTLTNHNSICVPSIICMLLIAPKSKPYITKKNWKPKKKKKKTKPNQSQIHSPFFHYKSVKNPPIQAFPPSQNHSPFFPSSTTNLSKTNHKSQNPSKIQAFPPSQKPCFPKPKTSKSLPPRQWYPPWPPPPPLPCSSDPSHVTTSHMSSETTYTSNSALSSPHSLPNSPLLSMSSMVLTTTTSSKLHSFILNPLSPSTLNVLGSPCLSKRPKSLSPWKETKK